ncbi:hypothetical protein FT663_02837 [Candidozyma haemuli var. vulneris]|uniref:Ubiquitin-like domain-containing protein n=1 Tax=Candidozyma haemuli TaxID=45357 RepID=A0A2V1B0W6_9ASCO|nr:hypothetical protein CXQ85_003849 [[Candida] haemuloni]KAF3989290.1 hypothetical protein FT662_02934 [[Candida] haemuloni var. vulneris]KAF3991229.1 hypothetical protein FT663_02837 [[Candida] haemuloni var. vulneris]PVH23559.1 hypothetical protein CXQ85_003849 [[Candida] haemuloni]
MSTTADDKQFFTTYSQLIRLSTDAAPETFYSTDDYHKLTSLGPSLPQVPAGFPKLAKTTAGETTKLNFKSIKPPFKFAASLDVPLESTVFNIKNELVETVATLKEAGATASNLKLMLKAKVLTDSTQIGSVAKANEELAITVMVSPPTASPEKASPAATPSATEDPDEAVLEPVVTEATWAKIGSFLALDIGSERAQKAVAQFKTLV